MKCSFIGLAILISVVTLSGAQAQQPVVILDQLEQKITEWR
ncbi:MAG: hypothetical protein ACI936_000093 [Paraglaciecola sp.]|jgi:hypothetical protein